MVRLRANTTDTIGNARHLFRRSPNAKLLKSPQFWDDKISVVYIAIIIKKNIDFAMPL